MENYGMEQTARRVIEIIRKEKLINLSDINNGLQALKRRKEPDMAQYQQHGAGVTKNIAGSGISISSATPAATGLGDVTVSAHISASLTVSTSASTGDYTDLQSAINALGSGGGKIFVRAGTYTLTTGITLAANNIVIEGEGVATVFNFNGSTIATAFKMADTTQRTGIQIRNIKINSTSTGSGLAIDASHFAICSLKDLWIQNCNGGISFNATDTFYNIVDTIRISVSGTSSYGLKFDTGANENTVMRARIITDASSTGVVVNAHSNGLYDVDVETGALIGIDIQASGHYTSVYGCYLESNITNVQLASGVKSINFYGGTIESGTTADITDNGAASGGLWGVNLNFSNSNKLFGTNSTGALVINTGTTSTDAFVADMSALTVAGQRDSHVVRLRGAAFDSSAHTIDWKQFVDVASNAGGSQYIFASSLDGASYTNRIVVDGSGTMALGTGISSVNSKAVLDLVSTTKGLLPPRMTTTQRDAISSPPAGLMIYNTSTSKLNVYTTGWEQITSA